MWMTTIHEGAVLSRGDELAARLPGQSRAIVRFGRWVNLDICEKAGRPNLYLANGEKHCLSRARPEKNTEVLCSLKLAIVNFGAHARLLVDVFKELAGSACGVRGNYDNRPAQRCYKGLALVDYVDNGYRRGYLDAI